jgi:hypothetical protein
MYLNGDCKCKRIQKKSITILTKCGIKENMAILKGQVKFILVPKCYNGKMSRGLGSEIPMLSSFQH